MPENDESSPEPKPTPPEDKRRTITDINDCTGGRINLMEKLTPDGKPGLEISTEDNYEARPVVLDKARIRRLHNTLSSWLESEY